MAKKTPEPFKIRVSEDILLKSIELNDATDIFHTISTQRKYLGKWLPFVDNTRVIDDTKSYIAALLSSPGRDDSPVFVIHFQGEFAGLIGFKDTDLQNKRTEIGYWLSEPFQRKGIMTRSVRMLTRYAFEKMHLNRVQIKCAVGNDPSGNIPKRIGFTFEGIERDGELQSGGYYADLKVFSLLRGDRVDLDRSVRLVIS